MTEQHEPPRAALHGLLQALFSVDELRAFLGDTDAAGALIDRGSAEDISWSAVIALERRGLVDLEFMRRIVEKRPDRYDVILTCARTWGMDPADIPRHIPNRSASSSPQSPARPQSPASWEPGDVLGDYEFIQSLGSGGYGSVWKCNGPGGIVALKLLHEHWGRDTHVRERFFKGATRMMAVKHDLIVKVLHPRVETHGRHYCVMEYIDGDSFERAIRLGRVSRTEVIPIVMSLAGALSSAHAAGFIHRDVNPANILIDASNIAHLADFDFVTLVDAAVHSHTGPGAMAFTAPEVQRGDQATVGSDIYSLAVTAIFGLHGRNIIAQDVHPTFIRKLNCSGAIADVLVKATLVDGAARYSSMSEFRDALVVAIRAPNTRARPASASFTWLHLTDLHWGLPELAHSWPTFREQFIKDLRRIHQASGPLDVVFFTGDLTHSGDKSQFADLDANFMKPLEEFLGELQPTRKPIFLAVPGNHDLKRDSSGDWDAEVTILSAWNRHPDKQPHFWEGRGRYKAAVEALFGDYNEWWARRAPPSISPGTLPGDFALTVGSGDLKVGVLGLNSAFLQLTDGDFEGKLIVDRRQFNGACGKDGVEWAARHHLCILLSHHPASWLTKLARSNELHGEILAPPRFALHLCGHMHEAEASEVRSGGDAPRRQVQTASLCGHEMYVTRDDVRSTRQVERAHGYSVGRIDVEGAHAQWRLWPRAARRRSTGKWTFTQDSDTHSNFAADDSVAMGALELPRPFLVEVPVGASASAEAEERAIAETPRQTRLKAETQHQEAEARAMHSAPVSTVGAPEHAPPPATKPPRPLAVDLPPVSFSEPVVQAPTFVPEPLMVAHVATVAAPAVEQDLSPTALAPRGPVSLVAAPARHEGVAVPLPASPGIPVRGPTVRWRFVALVAAVLCTIPLIFMMSNWTRWAPPGAPGVQQAAVAPDSPPTPTPISPEPLAPKPTGEPQTAVAPDPETTPTPVTPDLVTPSAAADVPTPPAAEKEVTKRRRGRGRTWAIVEEPRPPLTPEQPLTCDALRKRVSSIVAAKCNEYIVSYEKSGDKAMIICQYRYDANIGITVGECAGNGSDQDPLKDCANRRTWKPIEGAISQLKDCQNSITIQLKASRP